MRIKILAPLLIFCVIMLSACKSDDSSTTLTPTAKAGDIKTPETGAAKADEISKSLAKSAETISTTSKQIKDDVARAPEIAKVTNPKLDTIQRESDNVGQQAKAVDADLRVAFEKIKTDLENVINERNEWKKYAEAEQDKRIKTEKQLAAEKAKRESALFNILIAIIIISGFGAFALAFFAIRTGSKAMGALAVACVASMCIAMALYKYFDEFVYVGIGILAVAAIAMGVFLYKSMAGKALNDIWKKRFEEVCQLLEKVKLELKQHAPEQATHIFGGPADWGIVPTIMSDDTIDAVKEIRDSVGFKKAPETQ